MHIWISRQMVCLFLVGLLPNAEVSLATMGIAFNTHALLYMLADGISAAVSTRVSNSLGANRPDTAELSTKVITSSQRVPYELRCKLVKHMHR